MQSIVHHRLSAPACCFRPWLSAAHTESHVLLPAFISKPSGVIIYDRITTLKARRRRWFLHNPAVTTVGGSNTLYSIILVTDLP